MKIYLVAYKFGHHFTVSGYNRLADFLPCRRIVVPEMLNKIVQHLVAPEAREKLKMTTGLLGYFPECKLLESCTRIFAKLPGKAIFHFIYPENSYYFSAGYRRPSHQKQVATYHQPVQESRQFIRKTDAIKQLDAVILLSESQREFFEPIVGAEKISVIPHGIDLQFFKPGREPAPAKRIIAVGNWLRDFPTLVGALKLLRHRAPDLLCDVVTLEQNRPLFSGLGNVRFHSGISDQDLLRLYHTASMAVLSLTGAAANNALLEALGCGLPIVATDLPAVREYTIPSGCRYLPPANALLLADSILELHGDTRLKSSMGKANAEHAKRYAWDVVAERTMDVYRRLD